MGWRYYIETILHRLAVKRNLGPIAFRLERELIIHQTQLPHFANWEIEAQRGEESFAKSHSYDSQYMNSCLHIEDRLLLR